MIKEFWVNFIVFVAFTSLMLFVVSNPSVLDNPFGRFIFAILNFAESFISKAILIIIIVSFCVFMLNGFIIAFSKKIEHKKKFFPDGMLFGIFWFLAWLHIIFTFISVGVGSISIFEKFMGIHVDINLGGLESLLALLIFAFSGMAAYGIYKFWFKSEHSPLTESMKYLE